MDGAFSRETDPDPNPCPPFAQHFDSTGIAVNARIVGDAETVIDKVKQLWVPGMKLIVVTYCQSPAEQPQVYDAIHSIAEGN